MTFHVGNRVVIKNDSRWNGEAGAIVRIKPGITYPYEIQLDMYKEGGYKYWFSESELEKE